MYKFKFAGKTFKGENYDIWIKNKDKNLLCYFCDYCMAMTVGDYGVGRVGLMYKWFHVATAYLIWTML